MKIYYKNKCAVSCSPRIPFSSFSCDFDMLPVCCNNYYYHGDL